MDPVLLEELGDPIEDRVVEIPQDLEPRPLRLGGRAEGVSHLAGVGGAQLEPVRGVHPDRVEELPPHELAAGDGGVRRLDVLLQEEDAVDGRLEVRALQVPLERLDASEEADAQPLASPVVLGDEGAVELPGGLEGGCSTDGGHGPGRSESRGP